MNPHRELRRRLMEPTNAVVDIPIDLHRHPRNVVPFRPRDVTKPIRDSDWIKSLTAEFWLPWSGSLPEMPRVRGYDTSIRDIIRACSSAFDEPIKALNGHQRHRPLVTYRQAAIAPEIGRHFGGRDHSTILHAQRVMAVHMAAVGEQMRGIETPFEWAQAMRRRLEA